MAVVAGRARRSTSGLLRSAMLVLALSACSSGSDDGAGAGGAGTSSSGSGGRMSPGPQSGAGGAAGSGGRGGSSAEAGKGGSGEAGASGFPSDLEGSCTTDGDCELCTAPIGLDDDQCCPGCPIVSSKAICAQLAAAFEACGPGIQLCPIPSCIAPGSPSCSAAGKCAMGSGIEQ